MEATIVLRFNIRWLANGVEDNCTWKDMWPLFNKIINNKETLYRLITMQVENMTLHTCTMELGTGGSV